MTVQMWPLAGRGRLRTLCALTPGLVLPLTVAAAAFFAAGATGAPVMLFALVIGIALSTVSEDARFHAGLSFASRPVLQFGVALLGLNISVADRKSTRLNSSHVKISYAVFCLKKKK